MRRDFFMVESLFAEYGTGFGLKDISFTVKAGEIAVLLGGNGSGKTTLLRAVCQQMRHSGFCRLLPSGKDGAVTFEEQSVRSLARLVSYIPQRSGIAVGMTVEDTVLMGFNPWLGLFEKPGREHIKRAESALFSLGLAGLSKRDYLTLSEGQKQLVMLARTIIEDSGLLILDEPDSALDFANRYGIMQKLSGLVRGKERAAVLSLHDPMLALAFADALILIKEGRCIGTVRPEEEDVSVTEAALRQIYGPMRLLAFEEETGKRRLVPVWDEKEERD